MSVCVFMYGCTAFGIHIHFEKDNLSIILTLIALTPFAQKMTLPNSKIEFCDHIQVEYMNNRIHI